jgi:sulfite reductase (ferredoxin)
MGWANEAYADGRWADAIYHAYNVFVSSAKALLLDKGVNSSTQIGVIREFDAQYVEKGEFDLAGTFNDVVLQINQNEPSEQFATAYLAQAAEFLSKSKDKREALVQ